jgi:hypothetical protein
VRTIWERIAHGSSIGVNRADESDAMRRLVIAVPLLIALAACEGPVGPEGAQGPAGDVGPEGLPGPGLRLTATGVIGADSTAAVKVVGGRITDLPALTCYESETGAVWIPVTDVLCVLVEMPAGNLRVVLVGGMPGWFFYFVIVF